MPFRSVTASTGEFHVTHRCCRGETVGGDAVFLEEGRADGGLLVLLADAEGHGPSAYDRVRHLERRLLARPESRDRGPADLLRWLTGRLVAHPEPTDRELELGFYAVLAVWLPPVPAPVRGCRAGFWPALAGTPGGPWRSVFPTAHLPLGLPDDWADDPAALAGGELLLAASDGIQEACPPSGGPFFGRAVLPSLLAGLPPGTQVAALCARVWQAVQHSAGAAWPSDDATLFAWEPK